MILHEDGRAIDEETGEVLPFSAVRQKAKAQLADKIRRCSGRAIQKKGKNTQQGYDFARETDVTETVYELTAEVGLEIHFEPQPNKCEFIDVQTRNGTAIEVRMWVALVLTDTETGFDLRLPFLGVGRDSYDKAVYKAYTGAKKYALMMTFGISTGADPENDANHEPMRPAAPAVPKIPVGELRAKFNAKNPGGDWPAWLVEHLGVDKEKPKPLTAQQTQTANELLDKMTAPNVEPPAEPAKLTPPRVMTEVLRGVREAKEREAQRAAVPFDVPDDDDGDSLLSYADRQLGPGAYERH